MNLREDDLCCNLTKEDKKRMIYFDEIAENILRNVSKENKKYIQRQLEKLDDNYMDYITYWNEKYYRNGFCDGIEIININLTK